MQKRALSVCLLCAFILSGCGKGASENTNAQVSQEALTSETGTSEVVNNATSASDDVSAKEMAALQALTFEEIAAQKTLSADDKENMVYQYVSDTVTVDTNRLVSVTEQETEALNAVVQKVNNALYTGDTNVISADMLNYMLWEMASTPYTWKYDSMEIKGIDAATRLYFVDVTYKTNNSTYKEVIPDSVIVRGAPNESALKAKRYSDYLVWLESQENPDVEYTKWNKLIDSERASADAMSVFAYGLQYDSVMDGYTADVEKQNKNVSLNTFTDSEGVVHDWKDYTFEDRWGSLSDIFATQDGVTLVDRLQEYAQNQYTQETSENSNAGVNIDDTDTNLETYTTGGLFGLSNASNYTESQLGVYTYSGLTEVARDYGAEMTFRMVFKYTYSISTDNTMELQSLYLYDYTLDDAESLVSAYTTDTVQNGEALTPFIERTIKSYRKAVEESNHVGLYNLFVTYDKYDTYIADLLNYAYINNGGFTIKLVGRKGDEVAVVVTQRTQKRAKGTYMSMPTYQEDVLLKVKLCDDDTVRIVSITTLNSLLIGEPLSIIRDVTGVSEQIAYDASAFTVSNAVAIEKVIGEFENLQLSYNGKDLPATAYNILDLGMSSTEKSNMLEMFSAINQLQADKVAVWLTNYETKSNLYVSVKLREVFFGAGSNLDSESVLGLINRNGEWHVISYTRTLAVPTSSDVSIDTFKNSCLAIVDKNYTDSITYYNTTNADGVMLTDKNTVNLKTDDDTGWDIEKPSEETQTVGADDTETVQETETESVTSTPNDNLLNGLF